MNLAVRKVRILRIINENRLQIFRNLRVLSAKMNVRSALRILCYDNNNLDRMPTRFHVHTYVRRVLIAATSRSYYSI